MEDYRGRVAVITGAASGIGRALALELATRGGSVARRRRILGPAAGARVEG